MSATPDDLAGHIAQAIAIFRSGAYGINAPTLADAIESLQRQLSDAELRLDEARATIADVDLLRSAAERQLSEARAALDHGRNSEWRPIGTAPRDGTRVKLLIPYNRNTFSEAECTDQGSWCGDYRCFRFDGDDGPNDIQPTYWMPLHDAPRSGREAAEGVRTERPIK